MVRADDAHTRFAHGGSKSSKIFPALRLPHTWTHRDSANHAKKDCSGVSGGGSSAQPVGAATDRFSAGGAVLDSSDPRVNTQRCDDENFSSITAFGRRSYSLDGEVLDGSPDYQQVQNLSAQVSSRDSKDSRHSRRQPLNSSQPPVHPRVSTSPGIAPPRIALPQNALLQTALPQECRLPRYDGWATSRNASPRAELSAIGGRSPYTASPGATDASRAIIRGPYNANALDAVAPAPSGRFSCAADQPVVGFGRTCAGAGAGARGVAARGAELGGVAWRKEWAEWGDARSERQEERRERRDDGRAGERGESWEESSGQYRPNWRIEGVTSCTSSDAGSDAASRNISKTSFEAAQNGTSSWEESTGRYCTRNRRVQGVSSCSASDEAADRCCSDTRVTSSSSSGGGSDGCGSRGMSWGGVPSSNGPTPVQADGSQLPLQLPQHQPLHRDHTVFPDSTANPAPRIPPLSSLLPARALTASHSSSGLYACASPPMSPPPLPPPPASAAAAAAAAAADAAVDAGGGIADGQNGTWAGVSVAEREHEWELSERAAWEMAAAAAAAASVRHLSSGGSGGGSGGSGGGGGGGDEYDTLACSFAGWHKAEARQHVAGSAIVASAAADDSSGPFRSTTHITFSSSSSSGGGGSSSIACGNVSGGKSFAFHPAPVCSPRYPHAGLCTPTALSTGTGGGEEDGSESEGAAVEEGEEEPRSFCFQPVAACVAIDAPPGSAPTATSPANAAAGGGAAGAAATAAIAGAGSSPGTAATPKEDACGSTGSAPRGRELSPFRCSCSGRETSPFYQRRPPVTRVPASALTMNQTALPPCFEAPPNPQFPVTQVPTFPPAVNQSTPSPPRALPPMYCHPSFPSNQHSGLPPSLQQQQQTRLQRYPYSSVDMSARVPQQPHLEPYPASPAFPVPLSEPTSLHTTRPIFEAPQYRGPPEFAPLNNPASPTCPTCPTCLTCPMDMSNSPPPRGISPTRWRELLHAGGMLNDGGSDCSNCSCSNSNVSSSSHGSNGSSSLLYGDVSPSYSRLPYSSNSSICSSSSNGRSRFDDSASSAGSVSSMGGWSTISSSSSSSCSSGRTSTRSTGRTGRTGSNGRNGGSGSSSSGSSSGSGSGGWRGGASGHSQSSGRGGYSLDHDCPAYQMGSRSDSMRVAGIIAAAAVSAGNRQARRTRSIGASSQPNTPSSS